MLSCVQDLIQDFHKGKMIILVDDEQRENEGDLVFAADYVTGEAINFMAQFGRGLICLALTKEQVQRLQIPLMVAQDKNFSPHKTAFTQSIEAAKGISTGISVKDRAHTIRVASHCEAKPEDIVTPGHVFPIQAQDGGVLRRAGHTEAGVDLARLAKLNPAAVICEIMNPNGSMARMPDLEVFAKEHDLKIGSIVDMISFRLSNETLVKEVTHYETHCFGCSNVQVKIFSNTLDSMEHLVFQFGKIPKNQDPVLVRIQNHEPIEDLLNEGSSLKQSLKLFRQLGGILVLLNYENKTTSLKNKISKLIGQKKSPKNNIHTSSRDERDYGIGAQILRSLGLHNIKLISNIDTKSIHTFKPGIQAYGLNVVDFIPLKGQYLYKNNILKLGEMASNK